MPKLPWEDFHIEDLTHFGFRGGLHPSMQSIPIHSDATPSVRLIVLVRLMK